MPGGRRFSGGLPLLSLAAGALLVLASCLLVLVPSAAGYGQADKAPPVDVIDGDTLVYDGNLYKLAGIDAPELGQTCLNAGVAWSCGLEAALALRKMVAIAGELSCQWLNREAEPTDYGAFCTVGTEDLGRRMLLSGYAVALEGVAPGYAEAEKTAKTGKLGIWRGEFVHPRAWRESHEVADAIAAADRCVIKGKITESGSKVYYLPGDNGYEDMELDSERGERLFCSDDAARLAGWSRYPR